MARKGDAWVTKAEIKEEFHGQESTLDNAIHALRARHIILPREGYKGVYRLQHRGFALWVTLYASKQSGNGEIKVDHMSAAPHTAALRGAKTPKPAAPMANP